MKNFGNFLLQNRRPSEQLLKLREPDGSSEVFHLNLRFILDLGPRGVRKNTMFWIYTKRGYENDVVNNLDLRMEIARIGENHCKNCLMKVPNVIEGI